MDIMSPETKDYLHMKFYFCALENKQWAIENKKLIRL